MSDLVFQDASQLAKAIRERSVSAKEVLEAHLAQIAQHNQVLNAIVTLDEEQAMSRAQQADAALARGELAGPLHGVPVTIKDLFDTAGVRTTWSYKPLANYIPQQDATAVARLRQAGAIIIGKTNMPQLAIGPQCDSPLFGRANNPWNLNCTPGGSTGGGAAAVVAGLSPLEIGSDLGGSIRLPAHFCGVFGFKPTEHRVSMAGASPRLKGVKEGFRHMRVAGPIARSVEDLRLGLSLIEGPDGRQWSVPPVAAEPLPERPLREYRFAWSDNFGGIPVTAETRIAIEKLAVTLEQLGCRVEHCNPPGFNFTAALENFGEICGSEIGVTTGPHKRFLLSMVLRARSFDEPLFRGLVKGAALSMQRYVEALSKRNTFITVMEQFISNWDAWLCPVAPGPAFTHRQMRNPLLGGPLEVDDQKLPYWVWSITYTAVFNLTGNPAVVMPLARSQTGLPIGIQVVGRRWRDMELLSLAQKLVEVTGFFQRPPGY
jgi:amidase